MILFSHTHGGTKVVINNVYQFVGSNQGVEKTSEKDCVETEGWGFCVHFVLGFQENSIYTLHLCFKLRYYIQNGAKFLQKLTPVFKNHMGNLDNFRQAMENLMDYFCPKNTFLQLEHYIAT